MNVTTDCDHGNVSRARVLPEIVKKLPTVVARRRQVGHDDVRVCFPRASRDVVAVSRRDDVESHCRQCEFIEHAGIYVPFDDEHEWPRRRLPGPTAIRD
jgi:hypothetical protein